MSKAILVLESGNTYLGQSFGAAGERTGEIVFNTSMTGYQEILTDPSYKGQMIVMTEPHIGNVGTNKEDFESAQIYAEGFIVREASSITSNWRSEMPLQKFLTLRKVPAISGVDTRALTKHIRDHGAMRCVLSTADFNVKSLIKKIKKSKQMAGSDLVKEVTCRKMYGWTENSLEFRDLSLEKKSSNSQLSTLNSQLKVTVIDFGVKRNILRCLAQRNCEVTVVPAQTTAEEILAIKPDGILLSNGPGDPAAVTYGIKTIQDLIFKIEDSRSRIPIFGICLGHQLLGLALGGKTFKLKFGHRGANHPVIDLLTGGVQITAQNHGFCVDLDSLKDKEIEITHINLNDNTMEGMRHKDLPIFSVQYHPESSAGPHDSRYLFDRFIEKMQEARSKINND